MPKFTDQIGHGCKPFGKEVEYRGVVHKHEPGGLDIALMPRASRTTAWTPTIPEYIFRHQDTLSHGCRPKEQQNIIMPSYNEEGLKVPKKEASDPQSKKRTHAKEKSEHRSSKHEHASPRAAEVLKANSKHICGIQNLPNNGADQLSPQVEAALRATKSTKSKRGSPSTPSKNDSANADQASSRTSKPHSQHCKIGDRVLTTQRELRPSKPPALELSAGDFAGSDANTTKASVRHSTKERTTYSYGSQSSPAKGFDPPPRSECPARTKDDIKNLRHGKPVGVYPTGKGVVPNCRAREESTQVPDRFYPVKAKLHARNKVCTIDLSAPNEPLGDVGVATPWYQQRIVKRYHNAPLEKSDIGDMLGGKTKNYEVSNIGDDYMGLFQDVAGIGTWVAGKYGVEEGCPMTSSKAKELQSRQDFNGEGFVLGAFHRRGREKRVRKPFVPKAEEQHQHQSLDSGRPSVEHRDSQQSGEWAGDPAVES